VPGQVGCFLQAEPSDFGELVLIADEHVSPAHGCAGEVDVVPEVAAVGRQRVRSAVELREVAGEQLTDGRAGGVDAGVDVDPQRAARRLLDVPFERGREPLDAVPPADIAHSHHICFHAAAMADHA
jgi:hypothetical protein